MCKESDCTGVAFFAAEPTQAPLLAGGENPDLQLLPISFLGGKGFP